MKTSPLSLMPEDLEKQLKPEELADLFSLLTLDKPPDDPSGEATSGVAPAVPRETAEPAQFGELVGEVAPGFAVVKLGRPGLAIVAEARRPRGRAANATGSRAGAVRAARHVCRATRQTDAARDCRVLTTPLGSWNSDRQR